LALGTFPTLFAVVLQASQRSRLERKRSHGTTVTSLQPLWQISSPEERLADSMKLQISCKETKVYTHGFKVNYDASNNKIFAGVVGLT
jgi:hypothetical protein